MAVIQGHGGIGIVEAVGTRGAARSGGRSRLRVGHAAMRRRAIAACAAARTCVSSSAPSALMTWRRSADLRDGTPVFENSHIGGLAELMVTFEEWVVPIFTKASAYRLGMVCSCVAVAGLGATASPGLADGRARFDRGRARLRTAGSERRARRAHCRRIDDHRDRSDSSARRDVALKVGATHVLDPNVEGDRLVARVRATGDLAHRPPVVRRPQPGRPASGCRRGLCDRSRRRSTT